MRGQFSLLLLIVYSTGCANLFKSRYAMDDPVYAAKYEEGAEKTEPLKKIKQAMDARHVAGLTGGYIAGGGIWNDDSQSAMYGAELGAEGYATSWLSSRMALAGYLGPDDWYAGADFGLRTQLPTRLTPFAGIGTFHGFSTTRADATNDGEDNDDDGFLDEVGEKKTKFDGWLSSFYPELGVHFWPTGQSRFTAFARYMMTSHGREHDDWLAGLQFTALSR